MVSKKELDFYSFQGSRSKIEEGLFRDFPDEIEKIVKIMQGFMIHVGRAKKLDFPKKRFRERSIKTVFELIEKVMKMNDSSLIKKREVSERIIVTCKHFASVLASILRSKGIPARARCGFAIYFDGGWYEDHWICEYWNKKEKKWIQIDAQMDDYWKQKLHLSPEKINPLDLKKGQFLYGSEAWELFRDGRLSGDICGFSLAPNLYGEWYIRGNMLRDFFSLNGIELTYMEESRLMSQNYSPTKKELVLLDKIADSINKKDFNSIKKLYKKEKSIRPKSLD